MAEQFERKIVLENGAEFYGVGFGAPCSAINQLAFHTAMAGYQEIISDPSSTGKMFVMTYPLIGNYGITDDDFESKLPSVGGLVVREYNDSPSNFRWTKTLSEIMEENNIPGISGIDTRRLTRIIRGEGTQKVLITDPDTPLDAALEQLRAYDAPRDLVKRVSCQKKWYSRTANPRFNVAAIDCGIKLGMIKKLNHFGCNVTIFPYNATAQEIMELSPDGLFISNGPGSPEDVPEVVALIQSLRGRLPIFGICLGFQLICLAYGAKTYKMKFGHHGVNHPVKELGTGLVEIKGQNHSHAVDIDSLDGTPLALTHINLLDNTAEGVECAKDKVVAVQYHPENTPGPNDEPATFEDMMRSVIGFRRA